MNWDTIASIATAIGVIFAAFQIRQGKRLAQVTFEDSLDQQYRILAMRIPVDVLLGKTSPEDKKSDIREIIFNYLDLCNEQAYLRKKKRVSVARWKEWSEGIECNLRKPAFKEIWEEVKREAPNEFTGLTALELNGFKFDPAKWKSNQLSGHKTNI